MNVLRCNACGNQTPFRIQGMYRPGWCMACNEYTTRTITWVEEMDKDQCSDSTLVKAEADKLESALDWKPILGEKSRTYHYANGNNFTIKNVVKLCVRPSGNHRLETSDGKKLIMAAGWFCLDIDAEKWVF
jgi:hypothetical protein